MKRWLGLFAVLMLAGGVAWFVLREAVLTIMGAGAEIYREARPSNPPNLGAGLWWRDSSRPRYYEVYFTLDGRAAVKESGRLR